MTEQDRVVTGGVDTHKDVHVAAVVDAVGRILATASFPATAVGYRKLLAWLCSFGRVERVGVEGTGSYGAGLARYLAGADVEVVEVNRPNRQARRRRGKSDTTDAEAAARAALNGEADGVPKSSDGIVESIRALRVAFTSTRDSRTRISNQIRDLIVTAPDQLRSTLGVLSTEARVDVCARYRPGDIADPVEATKTALRALARQHEALTDDLDALRREIIRCLKRYIAREVFALITKPQTSIGGAELRAARTAAKLSLATAAAQLGTWPTRLSELERSVKHNADLATRYHAWLTVQISA